MGARSSRGRASSTPGSPLLRAYWQHQRHEVLGSLESLLTHRLGFGLSTATPLQRQLARLVDGAPTLDPSNPELLEAVGDVTPLVGVRPREVTIVAAIRSAKTMLSAAAAIRMTQTVDLEGLGHGEIPRVPILSLDLDLAPPDVERGDDLVVRRGRGVGHVGLVEGLLDLALEGRILAISGDIDHKSRRT